MGYDVAAIALLELPAKKVAAWKRRKADSSTFDDWPEPLIAVAAPPVTVQQVLKELATALKDRACAIRIDGGRVELAAVMPEHLLAEYGARLVSAFRVAAVYGAHGRVDIVPFWTDGPALGFSIQPEGTQVLHYSEVGIDRVTKSAPYRWLDQTMEGATPSMPSFARQWLRTVPETTPAQPAASISGSAARGALIVSGRVTFRNKTTLRKWNRELIAPAEMAPSPLGAYGGAIAKITPAELQREIQAVDPPIAALRISLDPVAAWVKGAIPDHEVRSWGPLLLAAFAAAQRFGGVGHLWLLTADATSCGGVLLEVSGDEHRLRAASPDEWAAAQADELHAEATQQFGAYLQ